MIEVFYLNVLFKYLYSYFFFQNRLKQDDLKFLKFVSRSRLYIFILIKVANFFTNFSFFFSSLFFNLQFFLSFKIRRRSELFLEPNFFPLVASRQFCKNVQNGPRFLSISFLLKFYFDFQLWQKCACPGRIFVNFLEFARLSHPI